jgi:uncharacterized repeat protein (TIGR01451 family)
MRGLIKISWIALMLLISLGYPAKSGAVDFAPPKTYPVGTSPSAVVTGDFNGDGKPDLAVANSGSGNVSILLGDGGTFQPAKNFATGGSPKSIAVGDFNGDHKLDLVVGDSGPQGGTGPGSVMLLLGNGDGTFQPAIQLSVKASIVLAADVNLDGKPDLIADGSLLLGNGDSTFQPAQNTGVGAPSLVGDFNGDGKLDLVADGGVLLGNGDGTFQSRVAFSLPPGCGLFCQQSFSNVVAADFNGDGKLDLAIGRAARRCIDSCTGFPRSFSTLVLLGNGDGTFQAPKTAGPGGFFLVTGDFNGDGKPDIAAAPTIYDGSSLFHLLLGKGDGTFPSTFDFDIFSGPDFLAAVDLTGDKLADIVSANLTEAAVSVMLNTSATSGSDLSTRISATPEPVSVTQNLTYTVQAINSGPQDATNMVLKNTLPAGVNFASATSNEGSCAQANFVVTCNISKLVSGDSLTASIVVIPTATGSADDTASASAMETDTLLGNNSASHTTRVDPMFSLKVTKSGAGSGTVTSNPIFGTIPNPINCGSTCAASEPTGTLVNLQVVPDAGSVFGGWGGTCGPPPNNAPGCDLTMNKDQAATATFDVGPNFFLAADASSLTLKRGSSVVSNMTILPEGTSFDSVITVSCSIAGPAPKPSCTPSPASVTPGANAASSVLTINSLGISASRVPVGNEGARGTVYAAWLPLPTIFLVGLGLASRSKPRKAGRQLWLLCGLLLGLCALQAGCGGGANTPPPPPPAQSYTISVTAASGTISKSVQIMLTVQ